MAIPSLPPSFLPTRWPFSLSRALAFHFFTLLLLVLVGLVPGSLLPPRLRPLVLPGLLFESLLGIAGSGTDGALGGLVRASKLRDGQLNGWGEGWIKEEGE